MRVLIGTPAGEGKVTTQFLLSFIETQNAARNHKDALAKEIIAQNPTINFNEPNNLHGLQLTLGKHCIYIGLYTLANESLLARGRNHIAAQALYGGWDKLFFIDADEGWSWDDFKALALSPHPLIAGVVPLKVYPKYPHNFETSLNFLPFLEDEKYFDRALRTLSSTIKMAQGHGSNLVKVAFTGTGFLCIDRSVLMKMSETAEAYSYPEPYTGQNTTHWSFFDGGPIDGEFLSEDWKFAARARELGFDVIIDVNVRVSHCGSHVFRVG